MQNTQFVGNQQRNEFGQVNPHLQTALYALEQAGFRPTVTSAISGPHAPNSAHFSGHAVDVGAVNGAAIGFNQQTWDFLTRAIASHQLSKIGTTAALVQALTPWARLNNVQLFTDPGTGPHAHLEYDGQ
jgi:hypothetical protein